MPPVRPHRLPGMLVAFAAFALGCAAIRPACAKAPTPDALSPPVTPACISSPFGPRILPNHPQAGTFHPGIDLPAPAGAPIRAIAPGTVIRVQHRGPGGLEILVQHAGFIGVYSHLGMVAPAIAEGRRSVSQGEKLGVVGHTGVTFGMHLYFGMLVAGRPVDPAPFLRLSLCHGGYRRPSDMLTADGKIPPTRRFLTLRQTADAR